MKKEINIVGKLALAAQTFVPFAVVVAANISLFLFTPYTVTATNQTPEAISNFTIISSSRRPINPDVQITAQAGNVSEMVLEQTRQTFAWQGFVGNVSGSITLDDFQNSTFFDWALPNPSGEIYATNATPVYWAEVKCFNLTSTTTDGWTMNETTVENSFNILSTDLDGLGETFNGTYNETDGFFVGGVQIVAAHQCPKVHTYVDESPQSSYFTEVLLTDNYSIVFAALIENNVDGFKNIVDPWDFQMMVLEDGHGTADANSTPYYFFAELE